MKNFLPILLALLTYSCTPKTEETAPGTLPKERPLDFVLETRYDGGMRDTSAELFVSRDSSFFKTHNGDTTIVKRFTLSARELDSLYAVLKRNKFDKIESSIDTAVLDRGGYSIDVFWNANHNVISVSDGQQSFIKKEWYPQWGAVYQYVDKLRPK